MNRAIDRHDETCYLMSILVEDANYSPECAARLIVTARAEPDATTERLAQIYRVWAALAAPITANQASRGVVAALASCDEARDGATRRH